jgi:hypothetical protein
MKTILSAFITLALVAGAMIPASVETVQTSQTTDTIGGINGLGQALASPWGDDEQSLPLFSGFMNPPPADALSPYSMLASKESQTPNMHHATLELHRHASHGAFRHLNTQSGSLVSG